jgi:uncharacterized membrane-anchored protein
VDLAPLSSAVLALGGESSTGSGTGIAVIALVSMVGGYLLLAGLWYFVFREKARSKRDGDSSD